MSGTDCFFDFQFTRSLHVRKTRFGSPKILNTVYFLNSSTFVAQLVNLIIIKTMTVTFYLTDDSAFTFKIIKYVRDLRRG